MEIVAMLREFNTASLLLRLTLAMVCGGVIGMDRERKRRAAGFRTYMLVCLGAALTMVLSQYQLVMLAGPWANVLAEGAVRGDAARFGAQVINGIGFLATGTILVTGQEVKGLTTAAGLWASASMGLAIGAGFYEGVALGFAAILFCIKLLPCIEDFVLANSRNMNLYVEFRSMDRVGDVIKEIKGMDIRIFEMEIERDRERLTRGNSSAVFYLRLPERLPHTQILTALSCFPDVHAIDEI